MPHTFLCIHDSGMNIGKENFGKWLTICQFANFSPSKFSCVRQCITVSARNKDQKLIGRFLKTEQFL